MFFSSVNERVMRIKENNDEIDAFIRQYKAYILSCANKAVNKKIITEHDDEYSIALMAFAEAVKMYDISKGNFLSFSKHVIKNRIIDYYRKETKFLQPLPIWSEKDEETQDTYSESIKRYKAADECEYRRLEIEQLRRELAEWEISFGDLIAASPKHLSTKNISHRVVNFLCSDEKYIQKIKKTKQLPLKEIEKELKIPRKTLERMRKYIIAVLIVLTGDYQYINSYLDSFTKRGG